MSILFVGNNPLDIGGGEYIAEPSAEFFFTDDRFAKGYMQIQMGGIGSERPFSCRFPASSSDVTWARFFWGANDQISGGTATSGMGFHFVTPDGRILGGVGVVKPVNNTPRIGASALGDSRVDSPNNIPFTSGGVFEIDVRLEINDIAKEVRVDVFVNGGLLGTAISAYTGTRPANPQDAIWLNHSLSTSGNYVFLREVMITDNHDTRGLRAVQLYPASQGFHDGWAGGAAELGDVSPYSRASAASAALKTSAALGAYAGPDFSNGVQELRLRFYGARGASGGPTKVDPFVRIGGTDYQGGELSPGVVDTALQVSFAENPATTAPWQTGDLATTEIGLLSVT